MNLYDVIKKPIITEKTQQAMATQNKYTFEVDARANKTLIAQAFETIFEVKPLNVNIINQKSANIRTGTKFPGMSRKFKKAIITLPKDKELNFLQDEEAK